MTHYIFETWHWYRCWKRWPLPLGFRNLWLVVVLVVQSHHMQITTGKALMAVICPLMEAIRAFSSSDLFDKKLKTPLLTLKKRFRSYVLQRDGYDHTLICAQLAEGIFTLCEQVTTTWESNKFVWFISIACEVISIFQSQFLACSVSLSESNGSRGEKRLYNWIL